MALVYSNCWKENISSRVFWVESNQVSYVAPSGQYRSTGGFIIYGKKNFLPPLLSKMEYGFTILFKLKEKKSEVTLDSRY